MLWNDIGYPAAADLDALFASYFDRVPDGVVNNRFDWIRQSAGQVHADFLTPEYSTEGAPGRKWESTRGIGTSFGFNREEGDDDYLSGRRPRTMLVDVVTHGGNLLLNVGPTGDGTIPFVQARRLLAARLVAAGERRRDLRHAPVDHPEGKTADGLDVRFTIRRRRAVRHRARHARELAASSSSACALLTARPVELLGRVDPLALERDRRRDRSRAARPATGRPGDHVAGVPGSGCGSGSGAGRRPRRRRPRPPASRRPAGSMPSCARISASRVWACRFIDACSISSMRLSTDVSVSSDMPLALAYRASIFRRTSSSVGTSSPTVSDSDDIAVFICSCIFAWSSWPRSFWRSASFCCSAAEFCCTAALAWSAAWVDCNDSVLRLSTSDSSAISRLANASAACVYSVGLGRVARLGGFVGHEHRLTGVAVDLLELAPSPGSAASRSASGWR